MASYEKIVKHIIEKFQQSLSPLAEIVKNQEIIIIQNKKLHEMLENIHSTRLLKTEEKIVAFGEPEKSNEESDYCVDFDNIPEGDDTEK